MPRSHTYRVSAVLDGEDVEVEIAVGPAESLGSPFAGYRDIEVLSARALDGTDMTERADDALDLGDLVDQAMELEEDSYAAALEDQWTADRELGREVW
jgi:hypothetical protein